MKKGESREKRWGESKAGMSIKRCTSSMLFFGQCVAKERGKGKEK